jgi:hypothetical protein
MAVDSPAFFINQVGSYPNDTYSIAPCAADPSNLSLINPNLGEIPAENLFRFRNNPLNELEGLSSPPNNIVDYYNTSYYLNDINGQYLINTNANSTLVWYPSATRPVGSSFNYFYVNVNPGTRENRQYYSYLLYPYTLALAPMGKPFRVGNNWALNTRTVLLNPSSFFLYTSTAGDLGYRKHIEYTNSIPVTSVLNALDPSYSLVYNVCASRARTDVPVVEFTDILNPYYANIILENKGGVIRPDSTFVTYDVTYLDNNNNVSRLGQQMPYDTPSLGYDFKSSYILYSPELVSVDPQSFQTFQLIQNKPFGSTLDLGNPLLCILSASINLKTSNFKYYSKYHITDNKTVVNDITGSPGTHIGVSYVADCPTLYFSNEAWQNTLVISYQSLGIPLSANRDTNTIIMKYPPHYYSFKASLYNGSTLKETAVLGFRTASDVVSGTSDNVLISSYIKSDNNFISYDLPTFSAPDYIKFTPVNVNTVVLSSLRAFYGPNLSVPYSLLDSPWVPTVSAHNLVVTYPQKKYGEFNFTLRPSLCSAAGYLDGLKPLIYNFAPKSLQYNPGNHIFLNLLKEEQNYIDVDASFLTNGVSWPTRDLNDSLITWYFDPPSSSTSINALDSQGNYIQNITPNYPIVFNNTTWTVRFSGYGPDTVSVYLSSQKYNETTNLTTNSALFDFFSSDSILIKPSIELNNLNKTRTIQLSAIAHYQGKYYNIPSYIPLYWNWSYDNSTNPAILPISVTNVNKQPYTYGDTDLSSYLSAVNLKITPGTALNTPLLHDVKVSAIVQAESKVLSGSYTFQVDDFPDHSIFNTDFTTYYSNFPNTPLTKSTYNKSVVTRPQGPTNYYTISSSQEAIPFLDPNNLYWVVKNNTGYSNTVQGQPSVYNIQITDTSIKSTVIWLCAVDCIVPGWTLPHNIESHVTIYTIPSEDFNRPLKFVIFPEFAWNGYNHYVSLMHSADYLDITNPVVYANKKSLSQTYYVSANSSVFNQYVYSSGTRDTETAVDVVSSFFENIDVPYRDELFTTQGLQINLTAYGDMYPIDNGSTYLFPISGVLTPLTFKNTYNTFSAPSGTPYSFLYSPRVSAYNDILFTYSVNPSLDLNTNRSIYISQQFTSPKGAALNIPELGTVTYTILTDHWAMDVDIPAYEGTFKLYDLKIGDAFQRGYVGSSTTNISLTARANIIKEVPSTTFDYYNLYQYTGERGLWNTQKQTSYITRQKKLISFAEIDKPEVFVSSFYNVTGEPLSLQFNTPSAYKIPIISYAIDYGENNIININPNETASISYNTVGSFYISYSAVYKDNSVSAFTLNTPIIVEPYWSSYDQGDFRVLGEYSLSLPYSLEDVRVQPNEWGDADIFNTSVQRLQDNLNYLISNSRALVTNTPTSFFGWLGSNSANLNDGIRWYTAEYGSEYYQNPALKTSKGFTYFSDIRSVKQTKDHIFIIDGTELKIFTNDRIPKLIKFHNASEISSLLVDPVSLEINSDGTLLFIVDAAQNRVYQLDIDYTPTLPLINIQLSVGGLGKLYDANKFNIPTEISYNGSYLYVLDFGNRCVKQYNQYLNWTYTYNINEFDNDQPIDLAAHGANLLYVLTKSGKVYVFDNKSNNVIETLEFKEIPTSQPVRKIIFDEPGEFIYAVTDNRIYKYSAIGLYISEVQIPNYNSLIYTAVGLSFNRSLLFATSNSIIRIQDLVEIFGVGLGLKQNYWNGDQLKIERTELAYDLNYNRSLVRMAQNIKMFRNSLDSVFVLASEQTTAGIVTYFTLTPIDSNDRPSFDVTVEEETLGVGVNELHTPQVLNREIDKLYAALVKIKQLLDIGDPVTINYGHKGAGNCEGAFCWSWAAMGSYNLTLPAIKICNINPITYRELENDFPITYAPSKTWGSAYSECCTKYKNPLG